MATATYQAPRITRVGSLHDLTLVHYKSFGSADGIILAPSNTPIGDSDAQGTPIGHVSGM